MTNGDKPKKKGGVSDNWWNSVRLVEVYAMKTLNQSADNYKIKVWLKYYMKSGASSCESLIFKLIFARRRNEWVLDQAYDVEQKPFCSI